MRFYIFLLAIIGVLTTGSSAYCQLLVSGKNDIVYKKPDSVICKKQKNRDGEIIAGIAALTVASYFLIDPDMQHET